MAASPNEDLQCQRCGPSDALARMFRACSLDPTEEVQSNLDHLLRRFMESCMSSRTDKKKLVQVQKCYYESKLWYYKILEGLLKEESQRPGFKNVSIQNFLEDRQRQCFLLVCCLEITSYTNKLAFDFDPQLIQIFNLVPYNFWKFFNLVFHWLLKKDLLTLDVAKQLEKVEEMIVDCLVWSSDSPVWEEIRANEGRMLSCQQVMPPKELEHPMRREEYDLGPLEVDTPSDQQSSTPDRPQRKNHLYRFALKVYKIMYTRLTTLCSSLNLPEELRMKIWTCFEFSLVHHFELLRDRQLHWLLLCATHDLTKDIRQLPLKQIINFYRSKDIRKHVPVLREHPEKSLSDDYHRLPTPNSLSVHEQEERAISCFCSQVYTPIMDHFVKKFTPAPGAEIPPLSPYPTPPSASPHKFRWRPGYNIYVSRIQEATSQQQSTGMDYVTQSSPSQRLNDINAMVRLFRPQSKRELTFTLGENEKDEDAGPSAKMPFMSRQSSLMRRLQEVEHDRRQSRDQDKAGPSSKHLYI